ncbi:CueP family metal-binding protein [Corynebacterium sp.]|uniref:CueP family metal-binding protein n=1 Tax=Corynebacterium sp. TaxID=1720 RepID=UPI0028AD9C17|nr:CueP family metal-binding protein [Corynebacterium sp.]
MTHDSTFRGRNLVLTATVLSGGLVLAGCTSSTTTFAPSSSDSQITTADLISRHDLEGLDAAEIIELLDTMPVADRPTDLIASVHPDTLTLTDATGREAELPLPGDDVYLSVAPYRNQTHDCYFHSLTTCIGELSNAEVQVTITSESGKVLVDEVRKTYDNGFVGVWVPRGIDATLSIGYKGRSGTTNISTRADNAATCITDLQLT